MIQTQDRAANHLKRLDGLKADRQQHVTVWEDCYRYTHPMRGTGFYGYDSNATHALNEKARLLDSTGTEGARSLAANVQNGMTPANSRWFGLAVDQQQDDETLWLDESADLLWKNIHAANFDSASFDGELDGVIAGWFALYIDEDKDIGGLQFECWPIPELYVACSKPGQPVDIVYREYTLTAQQAVEQFGADKLSSKIVTAAEKDPYCKFTFVRCIFPREGATTGAKRNRNMPIASVTIECEGRKIVAESGYQEMPVVVPRWNVMPGTAYAVGPVFDALPDIKQLNALCGFELAAAELAVAGMWIAEDDGVLNPRQIKLGPRKVVIANSVDSMKPLQTGSNFEVSEMMKQQLQAQIRRALMADQLTPKEGPQMTATEINVRVQLIRQLLGPVYGRLQAEFLKPLVERCFGLAFRAGIFSPPPDSLRGRIISVKFISPLARSQQMEDVVAIEQTYQDAAFIAQAKQDTSIFDLLDDDEALRTIQEARGAPAKIMRKSEDVAAVRIQRQQAQQQAMQQQQAQAMQQEAGSAMIQTMAKNAQGA